MRGRHHGRFKQAPDYSLPTDERDNEMDALPSEPNWDQIGERLERAIASGDYSERTVEFLSSLSDSLERYGRLSERQLEKFEEIEERRRR